MNKILFLIISLITTISGYSQTFRLGITANFLTGNKYYNYQFGPSLLSEYSFEKIPISISASVRIYVSELNNDYLPGYNNNVVSFGASVNYFPIKWAIEPYFGLGLFYNSNNMEAGGMPATINESTISVENVKNNFSTELTAGIKFSAKTTVNFIVEITQTFSKKGRIITDSLKGNVDVMEVDIFNSLFIKFGLLFRI